MDIREGIKLKDHTTFHIGGPADFFVQVDSIEALQATVRTAHTKKLPLTIIGGGSNMLVADEGICGLVIKMCIQGIAYTAISEYEVMVRAGAGVILDDLVRDTVEKGYWGLENLSAIPGTVGATPLQNVGAYGVEVASKIMEVEAYDTEQETMRIFTNDECAFGYRASFFKTDAGKKYIITQVSFRLTKIPAPHVQYADLRRVFSDAHPTQKDIRDTVIEIRSKKFPDWHSVGTAGSFFKNPFVSKEKFANIKLHYPELPGYEHIDGTIKIPLGWVLDKIVRMRGVRQGRVGSYEGQALVIVNYGGATARDVDIFASSIEEKVSHILGVTIEREVRIYV